jgi:hypothetical protein
MVRILAFVTVLTLGLALAQDDFWPPLQEQWRCLDQSKSFDYVMQTHDLLVHSPQMNPEYAAYQDFDCPVIDPVDSETWCVNGADFYPVPCNCHAYYRCFTMEAGKPMVPCVYKCKPFDLVFDPNTKSCVKEDQAPPGTCYTTSTRPPTGTTPTKPPTTPKPTTASTTTPKPTVPTTVPTTTPWWPGVDCEYEGQKLPYPGDCHKYYRCIKGTTPGHDFDVEVFTCGDWAFDPNQGSCVWDDMENDLCEA